MINNFVFVLNLPINYISHHLTHFQFDIVKFRFINNISNIYSFWVLNLDSVILSFILGFIFLFFFKNTMSSVKYNLLPNKLQLFLEIIMLFILNNVKDIYGKKDKVVFSLSYTVFTWISLMNLMTVLPLDFFSFLIKKLFNVNNFILAPSSDINVTLAISLSVLFFIIYFKLKKNGVLKSLKEFCFYPFNHKLFIPCNIFLEIISFFSKILSLSLRLFGNIYSGEIILILIIYFIPWWIQWLIVFLCLILHSFISLLQSFIFMILTLIYIS